MIFNRLYPLARGVLFRLDPETAHDVVLGHIDRAYALKLTRCVAADRKAPRSVFGLDFRNPVGLAAGLDKNGDHIDALADLGFGFIEVGTITPRAQPGNPKPRMFRIPEAQALVNRLGFNNRGLEVMVENLKRSRFLRDGGIVGANIGKNFDTPNERANDDYLTCLRAVYPLASYVTVNISSPNTKGLRNLQEGDALASLLQALVRERDHLKSTPRRHVPMLLKIAPDLTQEQVEAIAEALLHFGFDGVIATNTTVSRDAVKGLPHAEETGGLSGAPVMEPATRVLGWLTHALAGKLPIIGVGGIVNGVDARAKVEAGASLVQIYTGFIYRGPQLIGEAVDAIAKVSAR